MQVKGYYVAKRNPSLGGLKITETSKLFSENLKTEISDNCLELIAPDYNLFPLAIYPAGEDEVVMSLSCKVNGDEYESRPHEIVKGIVVSNKDLEELTEVIFQPDFERKFFSNMSEVEDIEFSQEAKEYTLQSYFSRMGATRILGFYHAVRSVIKNKRKIQLIVGKGKERVVQAACYSVLSPSLRKELFTISNGECTLQDADILITRDIKYQDAEKYERMTLKEFIREGIELAEKFEEERQENNVNTAVDLCITYIQNSKTLEQMLFDVQDMRKKFTKLEDKRFQNQLRSKLIDIIGEKKKRKEFVQILYLAYELSNKARSMQDRILVPVPYDIEGMVMFLKKHCSKKRDIDNYLKLMMEVLLENYTIYISSSNIDREIKKGLKKWKKAMVF